jgi:hypothetical protein
MQPWRSEFAERDPRTMHVNGSEAELDCRQTGDAQRCEREPTGSPIPYTEAETGYCVQGVLEAGSLSIFVD